MDRLKGDSMMMVMELVDGAEYEMFCKHKKQNCESKITQKS